MLILDEFFTVINTGRWAFYILYIVTHQGATMQWLWQSLHSLSALVVSVLNIVDAKIIFLRSSLTYGAGSL